MLPAIVSGRRKALPSFRVTPLVHALPSDPGGGPTRLPYRRLDLLPSAMRTASAFSSFGREDYPSGPRHCTISGLNHTACILANARLRTPRCRGARGFATVLPGLRLWTGRTCPVDLPAHRLGNINEFHSPPSSPRFGLVLARPHRYSRPRGCFPLGFLP
jgi:hypothetical protein